jgi:hypothetical protein
LQAYEPHIVHGLLQTADYAAAVMRADLEMRTDERIAEMIHVRTERQKAIIRQDDPLTLWVVMDEAALRRRVGGPDIMREQLTHIAGLAERLQNVTVQVLPFAGGANVGSRGPFTVMNFAAGGSSDRGAVYVEHYASSIYLEESSEIERHTLVFQHLCAQALPPLESISMIRKAAQEFPT